MTNGILVGADAQQEWLLPWWWENYQASNSFPVAFVDFGLSKQGRRFCAQKGEVIDLSTQIAVKHKEEISPALALQWERVYKEPVWALRQAWYKKPFALLQTPYDYTLWLDLDCEVLDDLSPLFARVSQEFVALAREPAFFPSAERHVYNSGVILFSKRAPLLQKWAEAALTDNGQFCGDQDLLSHLIHTHGFAIEELPQEYNWRLSRGLNLNARIIHWVGEAGKAHLRTHGGLKSSYQNFFKSINN